MFNLKGKKGLIVGVANDKSIAYGCAKILKENGAEVAITYLNDKARRFVDPIAEELEVSIYEPLDVMVEGSMERVFEKIEKEWGEIDFLIHSIAFSKLEDLHSPLVNCSEDGFAMTLNVSCYSFIKMTNLAVPLMKNGGSIIAMSYYGAEKVVHDYDIMGVAKAALEASTRYLAYNLADKNIRVNAISPGTIKTRAASGIKNFDNLIKEMEKRTPGHKLADIYDVGYMAAWLISDASKFKTGDVEFVDYGMHNIG